MLTENPALITPRDQLSNEPITVCYCLKTGPNIQRCPMSQTVNDFNFLSLLSFLMSFPAEAQ